MCGSGPTGVEGRRDCQREGSPAGRAACGDDVYANGVTERQRPQLLLAACSIPRRFSKRREGEMDVVYLDLKSLLKDPDVGAARGTRRHGRGGRSAGERESVALHRRRRGGGGRQRWRRRRGAGEGEPGSLVARQEDGRVARSSSAAEMASAAGAGAREASARAKREDPGRGMGVASARGRGGRGAAGLQGRPTANASGRRNRRWGGGEPRTVGERRVGEGRGRAAGRGTVGVVGGVRERETGTEAQSHGARQSRGAQADTQAARPTGVGR